MEPNILMATKQWTLVQPLVSAFVGAIVRDFAVRDDLLQEIAVAILESYERYDSSKPFQSWALGIARNKVRGYLRQKGRERLAFDEEAITNLADAFDESSAYLTSLEHLRTCVGKLDSKAREILELRYANDFKPAAIAPRMNLSANAVAKALQRIRDTLRDCIRKQLATEQGT